MSHLIAVLNILSDGRFHSGQSIGSTLGVSRTAIWKSIKKIRQDWQVEIQSVTGKGYRISGGLNLLDADSINSTLSESTQTQLYLLEVLFSVKSTNQYLMKKVGSGIRSGHVVIAEHQSAGRGRRGRDWLSPFGQNLYLSILWEFVEPISGLSGLSLAIAIAILRSLKKAGISDAGLKWPNDIHWHGKKLCGILLEMKGEESGAWNVVIGIGLNVNMQYDHSEVITQPWTSLQQITGAVMDRNTIVVNIIKELFEVLEQFSKKGLEVFREEWILNDVTMNKTIKLHTAQDTITGIVRGIDDQGALVLEVNGVSQHYHAGEVSLSYNEPLC